MESAKMVWQVCWRAPFTSLFSSWLKCKGTNSPHRNLRRRWQHTWSTPLPVLTMFTKHNCSLCDIAKNDLQAYTHRFQLKEVDITLPENKKWFDCYQYDIPVFHRNGQFLMKHKIDFAVLEDFLKQH